MTRCLILMYHQIAEPLSAREHRFCTPPREFARQMSVLRADGYTPISLDQLLDCLDGRSSCPPKPVHVTFDDGFVGVLENALPVLQAHDVPATLFALPGYLGGINAWMTAREFPRRALLSAEQLRELDASGVTIGSHTLHHPRLPELPPEEATNEIGESRMRLEDILGKRVDYFAYPFGLLNGSVRDAVEHAGYRAACSTQAGYNRVDQDRFLLRRLDIFGTDQLWRFRQKLRFGTNQAGRLQPLAYYLNRLGSRFGLSQ